ncbi:hypothetical protein VNO77_41889 [Canavalia gladiata]|uniref:Uncharacterized protein n=1 Tax=Canavalia gladiata TaxID=3824 RepID=A0AAN9K2A3_CANGL
MHFQWTRAIYVCIMVIFSPLQSFLLKEKFLSQEHDLAEDPSLRELVPTQALPFWMIATLYLLQSEMNDQLHSATAWLEFMEVELSGLQGLTGLFAWFGLATTRCIGQGNFGNQKSETTMLFCLCDVMGEWLTQDCLWRDMTSMEHLVKLEWHQHPTPWFYYISLGSLGLACMYYAFIASLGVYFSPYGPIMFCNTLPYAYSLPERRCWFIRTNNLVLSLYNLDYAT